MSFNHKIELKPSRFEKFLLWVGRLFKANIILGYAPDKTDLRALTDVLKDTPEIFDLSIDHQFDRKEMESLVNPQHKVQMVREKMLHDLISTMDASKFVEWIELTDIDRDVLIAKIRIVKPNSLNNA